MTVLEISPAALGAIMVGFGAILAFLANAFWKYREEATRKSRENREQIDKLTADIALLQMQFMPFWASVQKHIIEELTHPSAQFAEMDELLVKLSKMTLTDTELSRLVRLLRMRAVTDDPEVNDAERQSAKVMLIVMEKAADELGRAVLVVSSQSAGVESANGQVLLEEPSAKQ